MSEIDRKHRFEHLARTSGLSSSSHDISPLGWADVTPHDLHQMSARLGRTDADGAMVWGWEFSSAASAKFAFTRVGTKPGDGALNQPGETTSLL
jgi:hypothetical protein